MIWQCIPGLNARSATAGPDNDIVASFVQFAQHFTGIRLFPQDIGKAASRNRSVKVNGQDHDVRLLCFWDMAVSFLPI